MNVEPNKKRMVKIDVQWELPYAREQPTKEYTGGLRSVMVSLFSLLRCGGATVVSWEGLLWPCVRSLEAPERNKKSRLTTVKPKQTRDW